jgi:hypothetical protein
MVGSGVHGVPQSDRTTVKMMIERALRENFSPI